jgi:hypothetical protein
MNIKEQLTDKLIEVQNAITCADIDEALELINEARDLADLITE